MIRKATAGFSLLEILIVIAVIAAIGFMSVGTFSSMSESAALRSGASEVFGALSSARVNTLAADGAQVHGVHLSSTTVTRFEGAAYIAGSASNSVYSFERGVRATSTLITGSGTVIFSRLTGFPSATGTIHVYKPNSAGTTTITVHGSGLVEYGQ